MFGTLSRSWDMAKTAYSILWQNKHLLVFPLISGVAALIIIASFVLPLWSTGTLETWVRSVEQAENGGSTDTTQQVAMWLTLFAFYFCNYFVVTFFNCGLIACVMKVLRGEEATIGYGLSMASKRLGPIIAWAFLSAVVGVILRMIENSSKRAGQVIAALLGTAWTAMTYFVAPTIIMEGAAPGKAIKRSLGVLKDTWGTALVSNFSIGLISFLIAIPVWLLVGALFFMAAGSESMAMWVLAGVVAAVAIILVALASSAADTILKALLYNYATGRDVPDQVDVNQFEWAFTAKDERG